MTEHVENVFFCMNASIPIMHYLFWEELKSIFSILKGVYTIFIVFRVGCGGGRKAFPLGAHEKIDKNCLKNGLQWPSI